MKKVIYKYATGDKVPEGAIYLRTITQTRRFSESRNQWEDCWYVWHYFLVEVEEKTG